MEESHLKTRYRNLPHWTIDGSIYFVTFRTKNSVLSMEERKLIIKHLRSGHGQFYQLAAAIVMADHVHLLLRPLTGYDLSRIMKGIKGASARKINQFRQTTGTVWQDESWDRIVRDSAEFEEKLRYMADNPVKAGLATATELYEGWYCNPDLM
jgi:REP element-mobilizing transposase RayT